MADESPSSKSNILWGLFAVGMGAFIVAGTSGLLGIDMHPTKGTPQWVGILAGAVFVAGGLAVMLQSLSVARPRPDGSLSPDAPLWVRGLSLSLALVIAGSFTVMGYWVAFGPGERHFSGGVPFLPEYANQAFGRVAFGFGTLLSAAIFIAFLVGGVRQLLRPDKS